MSSAPAFGLLSYPGIANLGDTIQSLAARRFVPHIDALIPRERLAEAPAHPGPLKTILNGWFMHDPAFWPPHPAIHPLLVAMHFAEPGVSRLQRWKASPLDRMLSGAGGEWLHRWGPVGARDPWTLEVLEARGIPAWHSGCLTLTLPPRDLPRGDTVVACDVPDEAIATLRRLTSGPLLSVSHLGGECLDYSEQIRAAERLLDAYSGAKAVVTTRIHCALPCLALGTPVLLLHADAPGRRVGDMLPLLRSASFAEFVALRYDFDLAAPPPNPGTFRPLAAKLEQVCAAFVAAD